ncbi:MAG TPA: P-loop NTPase, partial [Chloroflexota bacterium]|nr:P-loop NTPase [Chloroflexota bacterium]
MKYETILQDFLPTSPEARAAQSEWTAAQAQVDRRISNLLRQAQQQASDTQRELDEARASAARLPRVEYNLSQKTAKVAQLQTIFQTLTDRYTGLNLTRDVASATATDLAPAVGAAPTTRTWSRAILTGLLCALTLALACAALLEQLDSSIHAVDDIEPLLQTPVLGAMPLLRGRAERRLAYITGAQAMAPLVLESCRIIRSNIAFATMDAPMRSVLITSADAGEGKSLSALNLATVMAFDGRSVVLLDCDLRRPSQHTLNGLPLEAGFTNVLAGEATLEETLQSTSVKNLKVMTAGTLPLNPPELLGS